jgi:nucleotide-binding universal stress UspA family protein
MTPDRVFARVLVGTDGSPRAEEAVRQSARLATATEAPLEIAFVIDTGRPHDGDVELGAETALQRAAAIAAEVGVEADVRILAGEPAKTLMSEAEEEGADLIGVGPDAGLLGGAIRVGQTAARVLAEARCSVLVARPAAPAFPSRIACAVDGSETSVATAALAAGVASATGAELRLIHVIPVFRGDDSEWTLGVEEASPPELEPAVRVVTDRGVQPIREMAMGRPESAVLKVASGNGTDLLVVGYRGVRGVRKVLLGSVSEHTAHHARCSVIVARIVPPDA